MNANATTAAAAATTTIITTKTMQKQGRQPSGQTFQHTQAKNEKFLKSVRLNILQQSAAHFRQEK